MNSQIKRKVITIIFFITATSSLLSLPELQNDQTDTIVTPSPLELQLSALTEEAQEEMNELMCNFNGEFGRHRKQVETRLREITSSILPPVHPEDEVTMQKLANHERKLLRLADKARNSDNAKKANKIFCTTSDELMVVLATKHPFSEYASARHDYQVCFNCRMVKSEIGWTKFIQRLPGATPQGILAAEVLQRASDLLGDQHRGITREGNFVFNQSSGISRYITYKTHNLMTFKEYEALLKDDQLILKKCIESGSEKDCSLDNLKKFDIREHQKPKM